MITTLLQYFQVRFSYLLKVTRRDHFITCKIAQNKKKAFHETKNATSSNLYSTRNRQAKKKQKTKRFRVALTKRIILKGYTIKGTSLFKQEFH